MISVLIFLVCAAGVWSVVCRINGMSRETRELVAWQHYVLAMGFAATPVAWYLGGAEAGAVIALLVMSGSALAFLLMGSHRWRDGAPPGTLKG